MSKNNKFSIKILSGGNTILVTCPEYEPEVFVPQIINNRVTLQNIIPNRQCCKDNLNHMEKPLKSKTGIGDRSYVAPIQRRSPLANSTPTRNHSSQKNQDTLNVFAKPDVRQAATKDKNVSVSVRGLPAGVKVVRLHRVSTRNTPKKLARISPSPASSSLMINSEVIRNQSNVSNPPSNSFPVRKVNTPGKRFPTPDIVRRAAIQNKNVSVFVPGLPTEAKIVPLHRVPTLKTPKKLARIAPSPAAYSPMANSTCISQQEILRNLTNISSFRTPPSLHTTNNTITPQSPNHSFFVRMMNTPGTATKWRKCITPQRTYIRRSNVPSTPHQIKPLQLSRNGNLAANFLINPITYPIAEKRFLIKSRKLIIDTNLRITPKTFRNQLKHTKDLKRCDFYLPKKRKHLIRSKQTAFDMLTNSSFYPCIAGKLNKLFRKGCLNKHTETILKYKQLTLDIPQVEG